jgi:predicted RNA-binding Zn ribbon-like protein
MRLDHDSEHVVGELMTLVNNDGVHEPRDVLASVDTLTAFLDELGISGSRPETEAEVRAVRRLRSRLRGVFESATAGDQDAVVAEINALIAEARAVPYLTEHDGNPLHLHYTPLDAPVHHRLGAEMAVTLAIVVRDGGLERLRVCASPDCGSVLVDLSRNRSRLYCDAQCANRQHVAAYRRRRAAR